MECADQGCLEFLRIHGEVHLRKDWHTDRPRWMNLIDILSKILWGHAHWHWMDDCHPFQNGNVSYNDWSLLCCTMPHMSVWTMVLNLILSHPTQNWRCLVSPTYLFIWNHPLMGDLQRVAILILVTRYFSWSLLMIESPMAATIQALMF